MFYVDKQHRTYYLQLQLVAGDRLGAMNTSIEFLFFRWSLAGRIEPRRNADL